LREKYKLAKIKIPSINNYSTVKPVDIFLQTQFIIAELNLIKQPIDIDTTTNQGKSYNNKTPTDVLFEMQHVNYMLERLFNVHVQRVLK